MLTNVSVCLVELLAPFQVAVEAAVACHAVETGHLLMQRRLCHCRQIGPRATSAKAVHS